MAAMQKKGAGMGIGKPTFGTDSEKMERAKVGRTGAGLAVGSKGAFAREDDVADKPKGPKKVIKGNSTFGTDDNTVKAAKPKVITKPGTGIGGGSNPFGTDDMIKPDKPKVGRTGAAMQQGKSTFGTDENAVTEKAAVGRTGAAFAATATFGTENNAAVEKAAVGRTGAALAEGGKTFGMAEDTADLDDAVAEIWDTLDSSPTDDGARMRALGELRGLVLASIDPYQPTPPAVDKSICGMLPALCSMLSSSNEAVAVETDEALREILPLVRLKAGAAKLVAQATTPRASPQLKVYLVGYYAIIIRSWGKVFLKKDADVLKVAVADALQDKDERVKAAGVAAFAELNAAFLPQGNALFIAADSKTKRAMSAAIEDLMARAKIR